IAPYLAIVTLNPRNIEPVRGNQRSQPTANWPCPLRAHLLRNAPYVRTGRASANYCSDVLYIAGCTIRPADLRRTSTPVSLPATLASQKFMKPRHDTGENRD